MTDLNYMLIWLVRFSSACVASCWYALLFLPCLIWMGVLIGMCFDLCDRFVRPSRLCIGLVGLMRLVVGWYYLG